MEFILSPVRITHNGLTRFCYYKVPEDRHEAFKRELAATHFDSLDEFKAFGAKHNVEYTVASSFK